MRLGEDHHTSFGEDHRTSFGEDHRMSLEEGRRMNCTVRLAEAGPEEVGRRPEVGQKEAAGRLADIHP
jgi:hypothetical protein